MKCAICGQEYGIAHHCAGVPAAPEVSDVDPPPEGFALWHYFEEALRIVTWDDSTIRRVMNDPRAVTYGIIIYAIVISLQLVWPVSHFLVEKRYEHAVIVASFVGILLLGSVVQDIVRTLVCHLLSKWFAAGTGKLHQLLGPLLLGSIAYIPAIIPGKGIDIATLAWIAVFAKVFQEVHGIRPLTAILISAGVGVAFFLLQIFVILPASH